MKKDLLICVAHHYSRERLEYLEQAINNFINNYKVSLDIIVDTNEIDLATQKMSENFKSHVHIGLEHPFHLTWKHRWHIFNNLENYNNFMYIEDDMLLPFENYLNYLENFKILWPVYVPAFVRIEENNGEQYVSDILEKQPLQKQMIGGRYFTQINFPYNYNAFWIMPQKELKESIKKDFVRETDGREFAAMYVGWELGKPTLLEIEDNKVSRKCFSYHLPNNYALSEGCKNGKLKVEEIFI